MDAIDVKRCSKCWRYLPITHFNHDASTSDRLTYRCGPCNYVQDLTNTFKNARPTDPDAIHS